MSRRALLLDLDRTLVDVQSFTDYDAALADLRDLVHDWPDVTVPSTDWTQATQACMSVLVSLAGDARWPAASAAVAAHERAAVPVSLPMPGLATAAALWAGHPVAVVTLLPADVAALALDRHGVRVDVIVGRDPVQRMKPHGDGPLAACARLGVAPADAVMVGDATWDLAAALDAGTGFVGVPRHDGVFPPGTATAPDLPTAVRVVLDG